jgi:type I restriction enzyme S subunit
MSVAADALRRSARVGRPDWQEIVLGDLFDICSSKRVLQEQWKSSGVPFYRAREIVRLAETGSVDNELFISEELYQEFRDKYGAPQAGDLMISAVGTLGACYVVQPGDRFYFKDASVLWFKAKRRTCPRFIWHAFRTRSILDQVHAGSGSTVGTYTIDRAKKTRLWLPPIQEQQRIAEILDMADALRAKRRAAIAELDTLTQSIFIGMFCGTGFHGQRIGQLLASGALLLHKDGNHGSLYPRAEDFDDFGVPFISAKTITDDGEISNAFENLAEEKASKLKIGWITAGDVLLAHNASVGKVALCDGRFQKALIGTSVTAFRPNPETLSSDYLFSALRSRDFQRQLEKNMSQTTRNQVPITAQRELRIPLPPIGLQREFARKVAAVRRLRAVYSDSSMKLDLLSLSLQQQAFGGMG